MASVRRALTCIKRTLNFWVAYTWWALNQHWRVFFNWAMNLKYCICHLVYFCHYIKMNIETAVCLWILHKRNKRNVMSHIAGRFSTSSINSSVSNDASSIFTKHVNAQLNSSLKYGIETSIVTKNSVHVNILWQVSACCKRALTRVDTRLQLSSVSSALNAH